MTSDVCKIDSDSDSLPELSDLLPAPSNDILKGDIVWAKFKKLYWPALVRNVYQKEKKITVWYADDPGKNFKLPSKNVFLFHDPEMTTKIKNDVLETRNRITIQAHEGLTTHAMTYLNRKSQGFIDDPLKFFDQTYPFFLVEDWLKKNPNANKNDFMDIKIEPLYLNHKVSTTDIRKKGTASGEAVADDSEIESTDDEIESDVEKLPHQNKKINKRTLASSSNAAESDYINKIVKCVTSGKADTHLANVISKATSSEHHEFYMKAIHSDRRDLDFITYGPVEDVKMLREITFYLLDLYDHKFCKQDKHEIKSSVSHLNDSRTEQARYVASVWLPESIIFAISEINNIPLTEAKILFNPESEVKSKEVQNIDFLNKDVNISEVTDTINKNQKAECSIEVSQSKEESSPKRPCLKFPDILKEIDSKIYTKDAAYIPEILIPESCKKTPKKVTKRKGRRRKAYK